MRKPKGNPARFRFARLLVNLTHAREALRDLDTHELHAQYKQAIIDTAMRVLRLNHPLSFEKSFMKLPGETSSAIKTSFEERFNPLFKSLSTTVAVARQALFDAAQTTPVVAGPDPFVITVVSESAYSTVGMSASSYANAYAEAALDPARLIGIKCAVTREERVTQGGYKFAEYVARANVEADLDVEILRRRTVDLREWVRLCWKRGVNPRVFQPHLPHGYEEKHGLDFFGGERKV
jgi:hypothetical protein